MSKTGYVIKRTVTYDDGQTVTMWLKHFNLFVVTYGNRENAQIFTNKKEARNMISTIKQFQSESFEIEAIESKGGKYGK